MNQKFLKTIAFNEFLYFESAFNWGFSYGKDESGHVNVRLFWLSDNLCVLVILFRNMPWLKLNFSSAKKS